MDVNDLLSTGVVAAVIVLIFLLLSMKEKTANHECH